MRNKGGRPQSISGLGGDVQMSGKGMSCSCFPSAIVPVKLIWGARLQPF